MKKLGISGTEEKNWGVNKDLKKILKELIKQHIAKPHRKDAMDILTRCTDKTVREFLHFALSNNTNLACACLDFAISRKNGKHIKNDSFGFSPNELE